ncbi:DUF4129 domain-containing protein [Dactylosporangium sucinum]|uniref:Protein-glutamine gamma-glutamyltransferase-like C-terminal domain-containing protein n=1 Tax=Dactylosporangium sucinum TaxID=1424081 RepID=A0A917WW79_9ACTN|nr:DUF4129 domain-containing protein [Dactylosporangium sucinum]GGM34625.1 hypothetical protein GCM10007977_040130 [Dactylosporangium sucinum]
MTREWSELLQDVCSVLSLAWLLFILITVSVAFAALHFFYPAWVPRRLPGFLRRRKRVQHEDAELPVVPAPETEPEPDAELPELPAHAFMSLADRLAAEGRYAEAVRERLRAIVRGLVERRVLEHQPGMTVTELARAAGAALPGLDTPLRSATGIFSEIWYGQRPATAEHDDRMRRLAAEVGA